MLDRIGEEEARATSIVKYEPGSSFPTHSHPGGEEILVLSGIFSEGTRHYPKGWYLRNPPGSSHQPSSGSGAEILVKLRQMPSGEARVVRLDTNDASNWTTSGPHARCRLFTSDYEDVSLHRFSVEATVQFENSCGVEVFLLRGELMLDGLRYGPYSWIRLPGQDVASLQTGSSGADFYLKIGKATRVSAAG